MNVCIFSGNVTRDPELRHIPSGKAVADVGLAINEGFGENKKTHFLDLVAWENWAESIAKNVRKGDRINVQARYSEDTWNDKETGQKRSKAKFVVEKWYFGGGMKKNDEQEAESEPEAPKKPTSAPKKETPKKNVKTPVVQDDDDDIDF